MRRLTLIFLLILLNTACSNSNSNSNSIKSIEKLEGHLIEEGFRTENVTNEEDVIYKSIIEGIKDISSKYYHYRLSFDEGDVGIFVYQLNDKKTGDELKEVLKKHIALDDKSQLFQNGNLIMLVGGGSIDALKTHQVEIVKTFKEY